MSRVKQWLEKLVNPVERKNSSTIRRLVVAVVGGTVVLIGFALLVLPGPAVLVIPVGLAILASEFVWARRLLHRSKNLFRRGPRPPEPVQD